MYQNYECCHAVLCALFQQTNVTLNVPLWCGCIFASLCVILDIVLCAWLHCVHQWHGESPGLSLMCVYTCVNVIMFVCICVFYYLIVCLHDFKLQLFLVLSPHHVSVCGSVCVFLFVCSSVCER